MSLRVSVSGTKIPDGVQCVSDPAYYAGREMLYLAARSAEKRLYTDAELRELPFIAATHPHAREWAARAQSADILAALLENESRGLKIMDLGCGNGWLANRISRDGKHTVHGVDLNMLELSQGRRVFAANKNLHFYYADIFDEEFPLRNLDMVVIASAIQYFPKLDALFARLFSLLRDGGRIHIIDSPFYTENEIARARERTWTYYAKLGLPEMAGQYYFHSFEALFRYNYYKLKHGLSSKIAGPGSAGDAFPYYIVTK